ncbi:Nsp1-like C-terminal region-domain-containing protein [Crassisporium funariophilum]|nr:Nsp1-like C-terminal region-domain-containing protein [Crassisporium funariophilum]
MSAFNIPSTNNSGTSNPGGSIFGGGNTNSSNTTGTTGTAPNPFGGGSVFGGTPSGGSVFGGGNNAFTTTPAQTGGNLFGGTNTASSTGGGIFGGGNAGSGLGGGSVFGGGGSTSTATNTTTPATNITSPFGPSSTASPFNLPKPADQSAGAAKPAPSSFFSQPSSTGAPNIGSGLFGLPPKPTDSTGATATAPIIGSGLFSLSPKPGSAPPQSTAASGTTNANASTGSTPGNIFGGGSFFSKPAATATSPAAPTTAPSAFSLGGNKDAPVAPALGGNLFGGLSGNKEQEKKDTPPTAAQPFNIFGGSKPTEKTDATSANKESDKPKDATSGPSTSNAMGPAVAIPPPTMLRGKTLEEIVNRWTSELETNVREFNKFAAEVAVWDRALIENGNNIAALHSHVLAAERQQNDINESLDHIEQQQKDLVSTLDAYEKVSQEIFGGQGGSLRTLDTGPADNERDKNYMLATDLHTHLDDLSGSLGQMIESVNSLSVASKASESSDDPMSQIAQILSSHLESLQWIDSAVREVEGKTIEVENRVRESGHNLSGSGTKSRGFGLNR